VSELDPTAIVGAKEIAEMLRVPPNTVHQWAKRGQLPPPEGSASGAPAWHWSTIQAWARDTGRLPGLREAILDLLLEVGSGTTTPIAERLIERGVARSVGQVWRTINDLHQEGFIDIGWRSAWSLSAIGRAVAERHKAEGSKPSPAGIYWTRPLLEGGPFPVGVRMRVRRVSEQREAEVKSPNGEPIVHREFVLRESFHPPVGFKTWDQWFATTAPAGQPAAGHGHA
jgi:predicted DNA-binding transcriptional regulator AlpA